MTCPAFLRLYHNPFLSDSQNYLLCSFLESRSFSLRAFVLHAGSWNSWELGSVVFSVTQWFPIVTLIREGEEPRVKGIIRDRSDVNKSVSNQTSCSMCRWRICRKLQGNYNLDLQFTLFKLYFWKFSCKFASYAKIYKRDRAHFDCRYRCVQHLLHDSLHQALHGVPFQSGLVLGIHFSMLPDRWKNKKNRKQTSATCDTRSLHAQHVHRVSHWRAWYLRD